MARTAAALRRDGLRRQYLLKAHDSVLAVYRDSTEAGGADDEDAAVLAENLFWAGERLRREYLDLLPVVKVTKCPHTGAVVSVAIDTFDIDGLWWAYQTPLRTVGDRPPSLMALTGALKRAPELPYTTFLVKPGPEVPYVLPRLLAEEPTVAVVSQVPVGSHVGYVIAYFSREPDATLGRANDWGANGFTRLDPDGALEWGAVPEGLDEPDFDLRPWVESNRLQWIAPGDGRLRLRTGVEGCPYLDLPGRHEFARIEEGQVR